MGKSLRALLQGRRAGGLERMLNFGQRLFLTGIGVVERASDSGPRLLQALIDEGRRRQAQQRRSGSHAEFPQLPFAEQPQPAMEKVIADSTARVLTRLNAPSRAEIQIVTDQIDALEEKLARLRNTSLKSEDEK
jgi:polyhydroxyalkanoate synthesis regulator phasin